MYKLLIVDDEPSTRYGLKFSFDWAKYGIEVAGEAEDGETALEEIVRLKPHIVITDVKMPFMDGIELSRRIRESYNDIKVIFISGYDDVDYLKSALKLDAIDYVFKPININELGNSLEKVVNLIRKDEKQQHIIRDMSLKLEESMPLLREKFFISLIRGEIKDEYEIKEKTKFLEINLLFESQYCVIVVNIDDHISVIKAISEKDKQITSIYIISICQDIIDKYTCGYVFEVNQGEFVLILNQPLELENQDIYTLACDIHENVSSSIGISFTIGIGPEVENLSQLSKSYERALEALKQKLFLGKNKVITIDNLANNSTNEKDGYYKSFYREGEKLCSIIKAGDSERLRVHIDDYFCNMINKKPTSINYCRNACIHLIIMTFMIRMELDITSIEIEKQESLLIEKISEQETVEDMNKYICAYLLYICRLILEKRRGNSSNVVVKIKQIVKEKYHKNITVADIAADVYLTSTYICLIFKQETGETINDYLTKIRIEKAKELLLDSRNKIYDISTSVGYSDSSYFSKLFKKYTGLNPSEYREYKI